MSVTNVIEELLNERDRLEKIKAQLEHEDNWKFADAYKQGIERALEIACALEKVS